MQRNYDFILTEKPILEDNPELRTIPEFMSLTDNQLRYIFLVDWYKSPLRMMKPEQKKIKAAMLAGYKMEKDGKRPDMNARNIIQGKVPTVEAARAEFKALQYDLEWDILETLNYQIREILEFVRKNDKSVADVDKGVNWTTKLEGILKNRKNIIEILNFRTADTVEDDEIKSTEQEFSLLDKFNDSL